MLDPTHLRITPRHHHHIDSHSYHYTLNEHYLSPTALSPSPPTHIALPDTSLCFHLHGVLRKYFEFQVHKNSPPSLPRKAKGSLFEDGVDVFFVFVYTVRVCILCKARI